MRTVRRTPLFTHKEAAKIIGIHPQLLENAVASGRMRPAIRGRGGPGRPPKGHRYTPQQVYGLCVAYSYAYVPYGTSHSLFWELVEDCSQWTYDALLYELGINRNVWTEEDYAK